MNFFLLFSLILSQTALFSLAKAPEEIPAQAPPQFEFYDKKNLRVYYETTPIVTCNTNNGRLFIQPSVSRHVVNGNTGFQFWINYVPILDPLQHPDLIETDYIMFSTIRRSVKFPLIYREISTNLTMFSNAAAIKQKKAPKNLSSITETAYMYLFPEDLTNLALLIFDTRVNPSPPWIPQSIERLITNLEKTGIPYRPYQAYSPYLQEITRKEQNSIGTNVILPAEFKGVSEFLPAFIQQRSLTISLHGKYGTREWTLTPTDLWVLSEIAQIYNNITRNGTGH